MTSAEFKKVGRLLKEIYSELEKEAIVEGIDIFSEEYIRVRDLVRLKTLERLGFTLEEYRQAKELVAPAKKVDVEKQVSEASTIAQDVSNRVDALIVPNEEDILSKAKIIAESVVKAPVIQNNIVERTTIEKPTIVKETVIQTINKETDLNPVYAEIGYLHDKLDTLEIPEAFDPKELLDQIRSEFSERFKENIDTLGMPDFRKLAMGLQAQIDEVRSSSSIGGTPAGNTTEIQFNDGGVFGSDSHFTYDKLTDRLHIHSLAGDATDGILFESDNGTDIGIMGMANTANATWYGQHNHSKDIEITDTTYGVILKSPDSTRWRITISNSGELIATSL
jgi:hypothetical protein